MKMICRHDPLKRQVRYAFTLAELLVVLVLIAVLSGGTIVAFRGRQKTYALKMATSDLAMAIEYAQSLPRNNGLNSRLIFDPEHKKYRIEKQAAIGSDNYISVVGRAGMERTIPGSVNISGIMIDGLSVTPTPQTLEFSTGGNGFYGKIKLQNDLGEEMSVQVEKHTGQVLLSQK